MTIESNEINLPRFISEATEYYRMASNNLFNQGIDTASGFSTRILYLDPQPFLAKTFSHEYFNRQSNTATRFC